jgi:hypothetical protein
MNSTYEKIEEGKPSITQSVATKILIDFFDTLQKDECFAEIAPRLRKIVLEDGVFAEPAIRSAFFPDKP